MKLFLSSTFNDLKTHRKAVIDALLREQEEFSAMEHFVASPDTPLETALQKLAECDVVLLVVGNHAGSLVPNAPGMTYTSAEFDRARSEGRQILAFVKKNWKNEETNKEKFDALNRLKQAVDSGPTKATFTTPDNLALAVIQSLGAWVRKGRPGARKTFASAFEYFELKSPHIANPILDFSTSLFGRSEEISLLNSFLSSDKQRVCFVTGRGGIGKSKLLHDWSMGVTDREVVFLKDAPQWHNDSYKEIPSGPVVIVVEDAHRSGSIELVAQLFRELGSRQSIKLVLSSRPCSVSSFSQPLYRDLDPGEIASIPELKELTQDQARALAREVLGPSFAGYSEHLADVAGYTPLVIVAGGRLIAAQRVHPAELSNLEDFRVTVFERFIEELHLAGPQFVISPTRPLLDLISALGPVDVNSQQFLLGAEKLLGRRPDEILTTFDQLATCGIVSRRAGTVRILPDVLSDYVLEKGCVGATDTSSRFVSTKFAERLYAEFGAHLLENLMRNLSELDWRIDSKRSGLRFLDGIWDDIFNTFRNSDGYDRRELLKQLTPAAFYQPDRILRLVDMAVSEPVAAKDENARYWIPKVGSDYVVKALPKLLAATAHHPEHIRRSVDILWDLASQEEGYRSGDSDSATGTLKRLASYHRFGWPAFNFAMLLQAIRLSRKNEAFTRAFTPVDLIDKLLEREGEFIESYETFVRFGGFGLNYPAVGALRNNALDFLEHLLNTAANAIAIRALHSLTNLMSGYLTRMGRVPAEDEVAWQTAERFRAMEILERRVETVASLPIRSEIYDAIRYATGINFPEPMRNKSKDLLAKLNRDADLAIFDAVCSRQLDLPILSKDTGTRYWETQYRTLIDEAHSALETSGTPTDRAARLLGFVNLSYSSGLTPGGFGSIVQSFYSDTEFLSSLSDQISVVPDSKRLVSEHSLVLNALHASSPKMFRTRARNILKANEPYHVVAASSALRVYGENAGSDDALLIKEFTLCSVPAAKLYALHAIAYMGRHMNLTMDLLEAVLEVDIGENQDVAVAVVEAFGPYGLPISMLTTTDATRLLRKIAFVKDLDVNQGSIPQFLGQLVAVFPDEVLEHLLERLEIEDRLRAAGNHTYTAINTAYNAVSFEPLSTSMRERLASRCLQVYLRRERFEHYLAKLFWSVGGWEEPTLEILIAALGDTDKSRTERILELIEISILKLAFHRPEFARAVLRKVTDEDRHKAIEAFVRNGWNLPASGSFSWGGVEGFETQRKNQFREQLDEMPREGDLEDLYQALARSLAMST